MVVTGILISIVAFLCVVKHSRVKKQDMNKQKKQMEMKEHIAKLVNVQIKLLCEMGSKEEFLFPVEIAKYIRDFALDAMETGEYNDEGRWCIHSWVIKRYPELFEIYEKEIPWQYREQRKEGERRYIIMWITNFESKYGSLQEKYNAWRRMEEDSVAAGRCRLTDCAFKAARESFAAYCRLEEIPFEVMLWYESNYEN